MKARERIVPRLMNQAEAAAYCRVSLPTFLNACPVPPVKIGSVLRFDRHRIDEWLDQLSSSPSFEQNAADRRTRQSAAQIRKQNPGSPTNEAILADGEVIIRGFKVPAHPWRKFREQNYETALADGFQPPPGWKLHPEKNGK